LLSPWFQDGAEHATPPERGRLTSSALAGMPTMAAKARVVRMGNRRGIMSLLVIPRSTVYAMPDSVASRPKLAKKQGSIC